MNKREKFVLQWHITHQCNLRCKHCYQENYTANKLNKKREDILREYIEFIEDRGYKGHINFTGGEPLTALDELKQLMDICNEHRISFGILTNGTLLTKEIINLLSNYDSLAFIQISLEGDKRVNDEIRGKGTFNKICKAIKLLRKAKIQTLISFTINKSNYKEIRKVIRICKKHGVDRFWADRLIPTGQSLNNLNIVSTEEYQKVIRILQKEKQKEQRKRGKHLEIELSRALQSLDYNEKGYKCNAGKQLVALLADGTLMPCRRLPIEVGNIQENKFKDLYIKANTKIKELENKTKNECSNCIHQKKCNNGARCLTYVLTGDFNKRDINCWK